MKKQVIRKTPNMIHVRFHMEPNDLLDEFPKCTRLEDHALDEVDWDFTDMPEEACWNDGGDFDTSYTLHSPVKNLYPDSWGAIDYIIRRKQ